MLPIVAITNQSTVLTDEQVKAVLGALDRQVNLDVYGYWNVGCTLEFLPKDQPLTDGWWQLVILDNPDQAGALGYHELAANGCPLGKVFAKLDLDNGYSWTVTVSHELLEMLVDPWINSIAQGSDGKLYALEICDAVEADYLGYEIDGVLLSDFVTPSWFEPTHADRYSFKKNVKGPFQLAGGGYISILDPQRGWTQVYAELKSRAMINMDAEAGNLGIGIGRVPVHLPMQAGSRRHRRTIPSPTWRRSLR